MASEELGQRYPNATGKKVGRYEIFECQLVTIGQFAAHGIIPDRSYGPYATQKPDTLVISRIPNVSVVAVGERKKPGYLTAMNWEAVALDLLKTKCQPLAAPIGFVTDGVTTYWLNGLAETVVQIVREDGHAMPVQLDFGDASFVSVFEYILSYFEPMTSKVRAKIMTDPQRLAQEVWQTVWRLKADRPEDCLATFVELFLFKFLDDLGLLTSDHAGAPVSFGHVLGLERDKSYVYYEKTVRPHIKQLFPPGGDGYGVINGIVLQSTNRDHNLIFHEILKKFLKFGSLRNTLPEFKTRLYESFLKESRTTASFGQYFTPRCIVSAIHEMAGVAELPHGRRIYDPAAGVGGFVLEQMARTLADQFKAKGNQLHPVHEWLAHEIVPKTAILAKANALVHCGDFLADQPARVKSFAKWLNEAFVCEDKTSLGSLEHMYSERFDLIMTNPPFVVSGSADVAKLIASNNKRKKYFGRKASGVEGLFVQFIVQSIKKRGDAWVLLPETFFLRTPDAALREWMLASCEVDFMGILPEQAFYNTSKRVVITHLKRRSQSLGAAQLSSNKERTLLYAISEIGETRDVKRFPCASDLPGMVAAYKGFKAGVKPESADERGVVASSQDIFAEISINLRRHWKRETAINLGLMEAIKPPQQMRTELKRQIESLRKLADEFEKNATAAKLPEVPHSVKVVSLGDAKLFSMKIGRRVLKKDIHTVRSNIPLYSANVRKPFGYVHSPNAGVLANGGALWSIDSDFDCRPVSIGEAYSITDHCGQIEILVPDIDPAFLAERIRHAGASQGFTREYRPSLQLMRNVTIDLPLAKDGSFDIDLMKQWADFYQYLSQTKEKLIKAVTEA